MNGETPRPQRTWLHVLLFCLTFVTTTIAGAWQNGVELSSMLTDPAAIAGGLPFSVTLMAILLVHEAGHYLMCLRHGVSASLPYFVPAPPLFPLVGTFGAFIRIGQ